MEYHTFHVPDLLDINININMKFCCQTAIYPVLGSCTVDMSKKYLDMGGVGASPASRQHSSCNFFWACCLFETKTGAAKSSLADQQDTVEEKKRSNVKENVCSYPNSKSGLIHKRTNLKQYGRQKKMLAEILGWIRIRIRIRIYIQLTWNRRYIFELEFLTYTQITSRICGYIRRAIG